MWLPDNLDKALGFSADSFAGIEKKKIYKQDNDMGR